MTLAAALRLRWDTDSESQVTLPFERYITIVNLRRIEIACLLALVSDLVQMAIGNGTPANYVRLPLTIVCAVASRRIENWRSVRAQKLVVVGFMLAALMAAVWGVTQSSGDGRLGSGYAFSLLSLALLFVLPPRVFGAIVATGLLAYCSLVLVMPLSDAAKISGIYYATIISLVSLIAMWLIYSSRRGDHEQRRVIRAQNALLTEQNEERDQLMAITAHDLRSPLYGLRNLLDLAARQPGAAVQVTAMRDATAALDDMIALVSRLLDAHSAEHEPLQTRVTEDIRLHVLAAARRISPGGETISVELPDRRLIVAFDGGALSHVLDNLLANAVRFSPPGLPVRLRCHADSDAAIIEIEDEGPGFDAAGRAAMFSKFHHRGGAAREAKVGTGMGLYIAARFAERMNATLIFEPADPTGARFILRMPLESMATAPSG